MISAGSGRVARLRSPASRRLTYCARLTATHYENFSVVTWLTPREHRPAFQSIYAFCRWSDDLGDEVGDPGRVARAAGVVARRAAGDVPAARPAPGDDRAGGDRPRYRIPIEPFEALISAFEQDQTVTEYLTYEQLLDYCTRSANPVGHLVLYVAGCVHRRKTPGSPTARARRFSSRTSGRTSPATWRSAGSTCRARIASGSATPKTTCASSLHAGIRRTHAIRGRAGAGSL